MRHFDRIKRPPISFRILLFSILNFLSCQKDISFFYIAIIGHCDGVEARFLKWWVTSINLKSIGQKIRQMSVLFC